MLTELTRLYKRDFKDVKNVLSSCTGSGDVIKIILTVAKLEWHDIKQIVANNVQDEYNNQPATMAPTRAPTRRYTRAPTRAPTRRYTRAPTTQAPTTSLYGKELLDSTNLYF